MLAPPPCAAFGVTRAGLPAGAAQGIALGLVEAVPLIPRGVPELVEQPVLGGHQPAHQRRCQRGDLVRLGEGTLGGDELAVRLGHVQRQVDTADAPGQRPRPGITPTAPDLIESRLQLMTGGRLAHRHQAPAQLPGIRRHQFAQHPVTGLFAAPQALAQVDEAAQGTPGGPDIEEHLHALHGQVVQADVHAAETQVPDATQLPAEAHALACGSLDTGLARRLHLVLLQLVVVVHRLACVPHRGHCRPDHRQPRHEPTPGKPHRHIRIRVSHSS